LRDSDGDGLREYARKFISDPGKRNGLYWHTDPGEPPSPLGSLVADASAEGYRRDDSGQLQPFHGYFYRILDSQGPDAAGGAFDYFIDGRMIGGFAVVAWPATYENSGVMTFIINQDGVVYQRNLGESTDRIARAMTIFDPGPEWEIVEATPPN
jgi:hypothetical protein